MGTDETRRGYLLAFAAYGLWGLLPLYWKLVEAVTPLEVTAARVLLTGLVTVLLVRARPSGRRRIALDRRTLRLHAVTAALLGLNWIVYVWAISSHRVVETSLGYFINPLVNVVLGVAVLGERLPRRQRLAVGVAAVGVGILTVEAGTVPWVSLLIAGSFGAYGLLRKTSPVAALDGLTVEMAWLAAPAVGLLAWSAGTGRSTMGDAPGPTLALLAAGLATAVPLLAFGGAARRIPLSALGLMQYVAPTLQFGIGVLLFGEVVGPLKLAGFGVVWLALVLFAADTTRTAMRTRSRSRATRAEPAVDPPAGAPVG